MYDMRVPSADVYTDISSLNAIKRQARDDRDGALRAVARQFESLLLSQVLESMRSANAVFAEGNFLQSNERKFYQDMFDNQLTLALTRGRSLGLADVMVRQLGGGSGDDESSTHGMLTSISDYPRSLPVLRPELTERLREVVNLDTSGGADAIEPSAAPLPARFSSPAEFVERLMPVARRAAAKLGVDPQVLVAQAALETGWGQHMIEGSGGEPSYNLFGIKADSRWSGPSVTITTTEYREGVPLKEQAAFRSYPDFAGSFNDYVSFLRDNPRYRQALESANDPAAFTDALQRAGYATDPRYSDKIQSIIKGEWIQSALDPGMQEPG